MHACLLASKKPNADHRILFAKYKESEYDQGKIVTALHIQTDTCIHIFQHEVHERLWLMEECCMETVHVHFHLSV